MSKVALVAHWDWVLYNFRLPLARALRERGHEVVFVCPFGEYVAALGDEGFACSDWKIERRSLNPFKEMRSVLQLAALYQRLAPELVHHFTVKPNLYGPISAWLAKIPAVVNTFTGLGYLFSNNHKARLLRFFALPLLRWALQTPNGLTVFQNERDRQRFIDLGFVSLEKTVVIMGSGVDTHRFSPESERVRKPTSPTPVIFTAARLLSDKGVSELVEAARHLKANRVQVQFRVAGAPDKGNPTCIPDTLLEEWRKEDIVEFLGHRPDIHELLRQADIAVLPTSYHEGVPRFLLEAAATGLPLIATDIEGCKMVVQNGVNGLLVPERDFKALAMAIETLAEDPALRQKMGTASRTIAQSDFDERGVVAQYLDVYKRLGIAP